MLMAVLIFLVTLQEQLERVAMEEQLAVALSRLHHRNTEAHAHKVYHHITHTTSSQKCAGK